MENSTELDTNLILAIKNEVFDSDSRNVDDAGSFDETGYHGPWLKVPAEWLRQQEGSQLFDEVHRYKVAALEALSNALPHRATQVQLSAFSTHFSVLMRKVKADTDLTLLWHFFGKDFNEWVQKREPVYVDSPLKMFGPLQRRLSSAAWGMLREVP